MLKKLFILFISANLCASGNTENPELGKSNNTSSRVIGIGVASFVVYTVIPNLLDASSKSNIKGIDEIVAVGNNLNAIAGAAVGVYALTQLYAIGKDIHESMNPSEVKKALIAEAHERVKLLDAKREFRTCLMKNAHTPRNASGIPSACDDLGDMFATMAGRAEFEQMTALFKDTYRN